MKILKRSEHGYAQDPTKNLGFEKHNGQGNPDVVLIVAAFDKHAGCWDQFNLSSQELARIKEKKVVRLEFEEPNKFFIPEDFDSYDHDFYKVYTLCPYTAEYLNEQQGQQRRVPIFFPFGAEHIPQVTQKIYDIIYTGHLHPKPILRDIKTISQFNYRLVSNSSHDLVTDRGVGYEQKINLISQSRITLVHNLLYPTFRHLRNVWGYPAWQENRAFSELPTPWKAASFFANRDQMLVPQLKSRAFEAAFSRSLILCKKDPFNVIEKYFEEGKEFVYFEERNLAETVSEILRNYGEYQSIIDNAFERASSEYTTDAFFRKFLKDIE
jgi:glycosyltransferase involved in cell wall biosynthesis